MTTPKLTVSGYRGIWGESLNKEIVRDFTLRFAQFVLNHYEENTRPTILLGRDGRTSGPEIKKIIIETITKYGINVLDQDVCMTPTLIFLVKELAASGGIMITASHNPIKYNGLKFITKGGRFINEEEVKEMQMGSLNETYSDERGTIFLENSQMKHVDTVLKQIDVEKIKSKKYTVFLDSINGAGGVLAPKLLEKLNCKIVHDNAEPTGKFVRKPEPTVENLGNVGERVTENKASVGFIQDPDADRLVLIDEKGNIVFEEWTVALGVLAVLKKEITDKNKCVVVNMSTTRIVDDIAKSFGYKTYHTKVGEANVVNGMKEYDAIIGGEGSGGIIYPKMNAGRDSLAGIALILELMAKENKTLSEIVDSLPKYVFKKEKYPVAGNLEETFSKLKIEFKDADINDLDGLRFDFADKSWIHLRASNTEPIIRLVGEAKTQEIIDTLFERARKCM